MAILGMTIGDFLGVIKLSQNVEIYDGNGESLYEGINAQVPSDVEEKEIYAAWVDDATGTLVIKADYYIGEEWLED